MRFPSRPAWFSRPAWHQRANAVDARHATRTDPQARADHQVLAEAQALGARLPSLLVSADRVASTVAQGVHGRRRAGMGDSFWQYRQALPGEAASRIDWRQSARSSRAFVRETEWEAAQTVYLWHDPSPSMYWRSQAALPLKVGRAELLLLALASLLLRGGEHVRSLAGGTLISGQSSLARLAAQLVRQPDPDASGEAGLPSSSFDLPRHAQIVLIGDMLAEPGRIEALFARLSAIPVGCTVLQILDPAELSLPYEGHVRFEGLEGEASILTPRAQDLAAAYEAAMAGHRQRLATLCAGAGFGLIHHLTDQPPQDALLALHQRLRPSQGNATGNATGNAAR